MNSSSTSSPTWRRLQARIAASRFFTFSLLVHTIIVLLCGGVVLFRATTPLPDFSPPPGGSLVDEDAAVEQVEEEFELQHDILAQPVAVSTGISANVLTTTSPVSFHMAHGPAPSIARVSNPAPARALSPNVAVRSPSAGIPTGMKIRLTAQSRASAMRDLGGKEKSEKAVMAGLRWLKQTQNADGSWATEHQPAMTGFAVLCYLGHGETPESPEFGPTVKKGLDWLLAKGTAGQGAFSAPSQPGVYEHAIAAYAMGEYYTMTKDDRVAELVKQANTLIVQGQDPQGGWQYAYAKGPESDTSVAGWQIQSLKAAHLTGLGVPGVDEALDKAMLNLKRMQAEDGSFGYRKAGDHDYSLTGVGVLCTYFWKQDKDKSVKNGIESLLRMTEKYPVKYKGASADLYAWYYHTQACLMFGGSAWNKWNRLFQDEIADSQSPNGSWPPTGGKGHKENDAGITGQTYRTTLCILMLEVFYRHMPTTR